MEIQPPLTWKGLEIRERGPLRYQRVRALVANLPIKIAHRECAALQSLSHWKGDCFQAESVPAKGPGNILMVELGFEQVCELFAQQGAVHRSSERIAQDLWTEVKEYLDHDAPIGPHLADQILLPMALAAIHGNPCTFVTGPLTRHTTTQIELLPEFLPIKIEVIPQSSRKNLVKLERL